MKTYIFLILILFSIINNIFGQGLDMTFSSDGKNQITIGSGNDNCKSVAIDNNGKIVMGGYTFVNPNNEFAVTRLTNTGTLDNTFDTDGIAIIPMGTTYGAIASCMKVQSDNKIVIAGFYETATNFDISVVKLNDDGSLDNSFDSDGKLLINLTNKNDYTSAMAIQSIDNKIILVGQSLTDSLFIIRLNTDGSFDNSFDLDGKLFFQNFDPKSVLVQTDGKILVTGKYNGDLGIIRLNANGSFDTSFDTDGLVVIDFGSNNDYGYDLTLLLSGKIFVVGTDGSDFIAARINSDGSLDNTLDIDGKIYINFSNVDICYSVSEDINNNDIILAGYSYNLTKSDFAICRISSTGTVEAKTQIPFSATNGNLASSIAIQSDRNIVVAGSTDLGTTNEDFAVIRLVADFVTGTISSLENLNIGINLFPNPASQNINIHSTYSIQQIMVLDVLGKEVLKQSANGNTQMDISTLPKGLYNFVITTDRGIGSKKVSVQ